MESLKQRAQQRTIPVHGADNRNNMKSDTLKEELWWMWVAKQLGEEAGGAGRSEKLKERTPSEICPLNRRNSAELALRSAHLAEFVS